MHARWFLKLIRWNDWGDSKLPLFFLIYYYLILVHDHVRLLNLILLIPLAVFFASFFSFGYFLNDHFDKSVDMIACKENVMSHLPNWQQMLALTCALSTSLVAFFPFYQYSSATTLLFLSYLSSILYSTPPFRLKEKGLLGIVCASLVQRVLPVLIVFSIFGHFGFDALIFAVFSFLLGLRWILVHQLLDRNKDIQAKVETFVAIRTPERTYSLMLFLFALEIASAMALVGTITYHTSLLLVPLPITYLLYELYLYPLWKRFGFKRMLCSYDFAPLADFYFFWLPFSISIILGWLNPSFFVISALEILWKIRYVRYDIGLIRLRSNV